MRDPVTKYRRPVFIALLFMAGFLAACNSGENNPAQQTSQTSSQSAARMTSQLVMQVSLRKDQIEQPDSERLIQMQKMGMNTEDLNIQRVFIYLKAELNPVQAEELNSMDIVVYPDSWIPPAANHPTGFILAKVPVERINDLASREYVVKLDTAENALQPQPDLSGNRENLR